MPVLAPAAPVDLSCPEELAPFGASSESSPFTPNALRGGWIVGHLKDTASLQGIVFYRPLATAWITLTIAYTFSDQTSKAMVGSTFAARVPSSKELVWRVLAMLMCVGAVIGADCPLTEVPRFAFGCYVRGFLTAPAVLKTVKKVAAVEDCWTACNTAGARCKSFRYTKGRQSCILFSKYVDDMHIDDTNDPGGVLYDRDCFTTNCNEITACKGSESCSGGGIAGGYHFYEDYAQYACGYGVKSRNQHVPVTETRLSGTLSTCDAISKCVSRRSNHYLGTYDVFFHLPSNTWICQNYQDVDPKTGYEDYMPRNDQHVFHSRFTQKNQSIGASYGFWVDYQY